MLTDYTIPVDTPPTYTGIEYAFGILIIMCIVFFVRSYTELNNGNTRGVIISLILSAILGIGAMIVF